MKPSIRGFFLALCAGAVLLLAGCQTLPDEQAALDSAPVAPEPQEPEAKESPEKKADESEAPLVSEEAVEEPKQRRPAALAAQAAQVGADARAGEGEGQWIVFSSEHELVLRENSRLAELDGVAVYLSAPLEGQGYKSRFSQADERGILVAVFSPPAMQLQSNLIAIDPGHGGSENGAENAELGLLEKELNLDVSQRLATHLEEMGYRTRLTRYDDRHVPLEERPLIANREKAGIFVSIHFNGSLDAESNGLETFVLTHESQISTADSEDPGEAGRFWPGNQHDAANFHLGYTIQSTMVKDLQRADRGVKQARFMVLKGLDCPGALVEGGFLSNAEEALLVRTPVYREKMSLAIAESIDAFMRAGGEASQPQLQAEPTTE